MKVQVRWIDELRENGKVISRSERVSQSFVKNFLILLRSVFLYQAQDVVDVEGNTRTTGAKHCVSWGKSSGHAVTMCGYGGLQVKAPEGNDTYGIVAGLHNIPVTADDYKLWEKIPHGSEDGKLYYRACNVSEAGVVGNKINLTISREFVNYGSVNVEVGEVGLIVNIPHDNYKILIIRDIYDPKKTIPPNKEWWVKCRIEVSL